MLIVWAFGSDAPQSKKNWARANLIIMLVGIVIVIILYATIYRINFQRSVGRLCGRFKINNFLTSLS